MKRTVPLLLALTACGEPPRGVAAWAADPEAAQAQVEACDRGRRQPECEAAREGLAEARRRERLAIYERSFR